jgi:hypothetical protein
VIDLQTPQFPGKNPRRTYGNRSLTKPEGLSGCRNRKRNGDKKMGTKKGGPKGPPRIREFHP